MSQEILASLHGGLIVSCQAYPGEPLREPHIMTAMAQAAVLGGAIAIRAQGLQDIALMRRTLDVPIVGLVKVGTDGVFITPTVADCVAVAQAGADIVAFDGTTRRRPGGESLADCVDAIQDQGALAMADCGSEGDAVASTAAGVDCVATTLAGYTGERPPTDGPDFELLANLVRQSDVPVLAEGRVRTPEDAVRCLEMGAHAVVVGSSITHPTTITARYAKAISPRVPDLTTR
ncbi:N-acetylmannosamine-6-phosphate 2-epimerase [Micromonospora sp. NPDC005305]|uniref:N-acetylmannosamine-6-phosphate 2-epimerase n=1 Tax=Micromonospora sp. NPDC005305 TaxID=3156875 RepID=UPI0033AB6CA5